MIATEDGRIYQGIKLGETPDEIVIRNTNSQHDQHIPRREIDEFEAAGTLMPSGLTSALPRTDLRDLIAYLSQLDGSGHRPDTGSNRQEDDNANTPKKPEIP